MRIHPLLFPIALMSAHCSLAADFDGFVGPPLSRDSGADSTTDVAVDTFVEQDSMVVVDSATDSAQDTIFDSVADVDPNGPPVFLDGGTSYCTGLTSAFCDDFDGKDLSPTWVREGIFLKLTSHAPLSAPNDLFLNAPAATGGGTWVSKVTRVFSAPVSSIDLAFAFSPEKIDTGTAFLLVGAIEFTNKADSKYSLRLVYVSGQLRLEESNLLPPPSNKDTYHAFLSPPLGKWSRIVMKVRLADANVSLSLDGVDVYNKDPLAVPAGIDFTPTLLLGAVFGGSPHSGWTMRYDDVSVSFP